MMHVTNYSPGLFTGSEWKLVVRRGPWPPTRMACENRRATTRRSTDSLCVDCLDPVTTNVERSVAPRGWRNEVRWSECPSVERPPRLPIWALARPNPAFGPGEARTGIRQSAKCNREPSENGLGVLPELRRNVLVRSPRLGGQVEGCQVVIWQFPQPVRTHGASLQRPLAEPLCC